MDTSHADQGGRVKDQDYYHINKNVKARKRHLLVDTLGMPLSICVTPADVQDWAGALLLVARRSR